MASGVHMAVRASATASIWASVSFQPFRWPPPCCRSKSYSFSIVSVPAVRGSMTVRSGSSISSIT